jgi:MAP/microtubule affinity-regulating kinase
VYLITEYVEGIPLNEYVKKSAEKMAETEAILIMCQLLDAVAYLHHKGICHRDIKLENLILTPDKQVKLLDFGFSVFYSTEQNLKLLCGTPSYMAPELLQKGISRDTQGYRGPPIDLWTCGIVFYALLTGHLPFAAHTERDLYKKI